jgi:hypothetical protein
MVLQLRRHIQSNGIIINSKYFTHIYKKFLINTFYLFICRDIKYDFINFDF